jgi:biotin transport system substrate-specific component
MNSSAESYVAPDTLISAALAPLDWTRSVSLAVVFSLLTALAAQIVSPVGLGPPITAQTFVVLLTGALLGSRMGAMAMIVYLVEGAVGLPFFSSGQGGIGHLLGQSGGYLMAFPAGAFITGAFAENGWDKRFWTAAVAMAVGSFIILLAGMAWFSLLTHTSPLAAFLINLKYIPGDIIKILLAAAVLPTGWALLKRKASQKGE